MLMVSDGVREAFSPDSEEFDDARLVQVLEGHASTSVARACAVVHAVRQQAPGPASDDLTVLALKRR